MSETKWECPTYPTKQITVGRDSSGPLHLSVDLFSQSLRLSMADARKAGNNERYQALRATYLAHVGL